MASSVSAGFPTLDSESSRFRLGVATWMFAFALVYLNLIPLRVTWLPFDEWLHAATTMPWLKLSVARRADWIANLFMFVPFGFMLGSALGWARGIAGRVSTALLGGVIVVLLAYGIETLQILVPQRTVSLNDVLAAALGGVIGIGIWLLMGHRLWRLVCVAMQPNRHALLAGLTLYCILYVLLSPFPYDFVLSDEEFRNKLENDHYALVLAGACAVWSRCVGQLGVEVAAVVPIGMALALWLRWPASLRCGVVAGGLGLAFGAVIELIQFLTYSGISQGVSLLTRGVGFAAGAILAGWVQERGLLAAQWSLRSWAMAAWLAYLLGVFVVTGFTLSDWGNMESAANQLAELNFQPFYYHYFVPEQVAMASLLYTTALYLPVGMMMWPWYRPGSHLASRTVLVAGLLALGVETAKLFALDLRPDPTNVLIGAFAAWMGLKLLVWLAGAMTGEKTAHAPTIPEIPSSGHRRHARSFVSAGRDEGGDSGPEPKAVVAGAPKRSVGGLVFGTGLLLVGLLVASTHPLAPTFAIMSVLLVVMAVFRWPWLWLLLVPAALPILDLRPWTGRLYFDEWDLLVVAALAALWLVRGLGRFPRGDSRLTPLGRVWLGLYLASYVAAVGMVLWPLTWPEGFASSSLHSDYNALRLGKGVLWALLLWPFFDAVAMSRKAAFDRFAVGMILGLTGGVASAMWERLVFPGMFDYSQIYRVTGFFSDTHTGGAFLEGYLVAAVPFLAAVLSWRRRALWWPLAAILFVLASYSVAVTFARAGYAGLVIAVLTIVVALVWRFGTSLQARLVAVAGVMVVVVSGAAVLLQVQDDEFMSQRVDREQIQRDWNTRIAHWQETLAPALRYSATTWGGLGVGRFPEVNYWERLATGRQVPAIYVLEQNAGDEVILNLMPGSPTYHLQMVRVVPDSGYRVRVRARSNGEAVNLGLLLCEQWLIYSRRCVLRTLRFGPSDEFQTLETDFRSPSQLPDVGWLQRPVKFGFHHARGRDVLQIESVSLFESSGRDLLANGDFAQGLDRWFFVSDDHLAWHVKHMWGQVLFEQGLIGLLLWAMLLAAALWTAVRKLGRGGEEAWPNAIVLASLLAFLSVGLFDSLFDAPRLATLFYLLLLLALSGERSAMRS